MTTRYRVEYALKTHRRDQFIEWIKGLLAVPFVLHSQPTAVADGDSNVGRMAETARHRYEEIMLDVEALISDHIAYQVRGLGNRSKLKILVPSIGNFFTPLALHDAFRIQDTRRRISSRRFVAPSFNDIRLILNTAQVLSLVRAGGIQLATFDGDVTLYDDGESLSDDNPVIPRLISLLRKDVRIGIVTAAGYTQADRYYERLHGLFDALNANTTLTPAQKEGVVVMGGESNYLFAYRGGKLEPVPSSQWILDEMAAWTDANIKALLDVAEEALIGSVRDLGIDANIIRKERAVGIVPRSGKLAREQLEETVLVVQTILESSPVGSRLPFCAFNGGNDVFVDIGDKSWGVAACQRYFSRHSPPVDNTGAAVRIQGAKTLHIGDQFLSAGANDFKARLACTTAWIANPAETVALLDEIAEVEGLQQ